MSETFLITAEQKGQRLDKVLGALQEEWSRGQIQTFIDEGHLLVNGEKVKKHIN